MDSSPDFSELSLDAYMVMVIFQFIPFQTFVLFFKFDFIFLIYRVPFVLTGSNSRLGLCIEQHFFCPGFLFWNVCLSLCHSQMQSN